MRYTVVCCFVLAFTLTTDAASLSATGNHEEGKVHGLAGLEEKLRELVNEKKSTGNEGEEKQTSLHRFTNLFKKAQEDNMEGNGESPDKKRLMAQRPVGRRLQRGQQFNRKRGFGNLKRTSRTNSNAQAKRLMPVARGQAGVIPNKRSQMKRRNFHRLSNQRLAQHRSADKRSLSSPANRANRQGGNSIKMRRTFNTPNKRQLRPQTKSKLQSQLKRSGLMSRQSGCESTCNLDDYDYFMFDYYYNNYDGYYDYQYDFMDDFMDDNNNYWPSYDYYWPSYYYYYYHNYYYDDLTRDEFCSCWFEQRKCGLIEPESPYYYDPFGCNCTSSCSSKYGEEYYECISQEAQYLQTEFELLAQDYSAAVTQNVEGMAAVSEALALIQSPYDALITTILTALMEHKLEELQNDRFYMVKCKHTAVFDDLLNTMKMDGFIPYSSMYSMYNYYPYK